MTLHHLMLAVSRPRYRYRSGDSYGDYLMFSWLWQKIHWWSLLVYGCVTLVAGGIRLILWDQP